VLDPADAAQALALRAQTDPDHGGAR
jgi:hypothetical protein